MSKLLQKLEQDTRWITFRSRPQEQKVELKQNIVTNYHVTSYVTIEIGHSRLIFVDRYRSNPHIDATFEGAIGKTTREDV